MKGKLHSCSYQFFKRFSVITAVLFLSIQFHSSSASDVDFYINNVLYKKPFFIYKNEIFTALDDLCAELGARHDEGDTLNFSASIDKPWDRHTIRVFEDNGSEAVVVDGQLLSSGISVRNGRVWIQVSILAQYLHYIYQFNKETKIADLMAPPNMAEINATHAWLQALGSINPNIVATVFLIKENCPYFGVYDGHRYALLEWEEGYFPRQEDIVVGPIATSGEHVIQIYPSGIKHQGCCSKHGGIEGCDPITGKLMCNDQQYSPEYGASCHCSGISVNGTIYDLSGNPIRLEKTEPHIKAKVFVHGNGIKLESNPLQDAMSRITVLCPNP